MKGAFVALNKIYPKLVYETIKTHTPPPGLYAVSTLVNGKHFQAQHLEWKEAKNRLAQVIVHSLVCQRDLILKKLPSFELINLDGQIDLPSGPKFNSPTDFYVQHLIFKVYELQPSVKVSFITESVADNSKSKIVTAKGKLISIKIQIYLAKLFTLLFLLNSERRRCGIYWRSFYPERG